MGTQAGVYWVRDRTRTVAERYGTVRSKRLRSFCKWQPELVAQGASERVQCQCSLECHLVEWLLDAVKAARTSLRILVCSSLESDGGF